MIFPSVNGFENRFLRPEILPRDSGIHFARIYCSYWHKTGSYHSVTYTQSSIITIDIFIIYYIIPMVNVLQSTKYLEVTVLSMSRSDSSLITMPCRISIIIMHLTKPNQYCMVGNEFIWRARLLFVIIWHHVRAFWHGFKSTLTHSLIDDIVSI